MDLMSTAELQVFGDHKFHEGKNFQLSVGLGEASKLNFSVFEEIMDCDFFIVFGCGILSGDLGKFLIKRKAINLHMGISPFFKGAACNFWAQYFGKSEFVGATIHYLSSDLDGGPIIERVVPESANPNGFIYGMEAVLSGQKAIERILNSPSKELNEITQDPSQCIHFSRKSDFTEDVVIKFLDDGLWYDSGLQAKLDSNDLLNEIHLSKL